MIVSCNCNNKEIMHDALWSIHCGTKTRLLTTYPEKEKPALPNERPPFPKDAEV